MTSKSMFKVSAPEQEDILVPSRELAETMAALFDDSVVTEIGRKDALASVRMATKVEAIPSVWLKALSEIETLIETEGTFSTFSLHDGPGHNAVALCAVCDANKGTITMTVKDVAGKASPGKAYADLDGVQYPSLAAYVHAHGGTVTSIYPMQGARKYNRDADSNPKSLKQVEVKA